MAYPIKNKERHEFYYYVQNPAISYYSFTQRCRNNIKKLNKELMEKLIMTPVVKNDSLVGADGRECTICKEYKTREYYTNYEYKSNSQCKQCLKDKTKRQSIVIPDIIYSKKSAYKSPFRFYDRKGNTMSVKEIGELEGIDPKYYPSIRQDLYNGRDINYVINRFISRNNDDSNMKVSKTLKTD